MINDPHMARLTDIVARFDEPAAHLADIALTCDGAPTIGHVLVDALEESGFAVGDYEVIAVPLMDSPVAAAMIHAAGGRGLDLDACALRTDICFPGSHALVGAPVSGRPTVLLANEATAPSADLVALMRESGAQIIAVASLFEDSAVAACAQGEGLPYFSVLSAR